MNPLVAGGNVAWLAFVEVAKALHTPFKQAMLFRDPLQLTAVRPSAPNRVPPSTMGKTSSPLPRREAVSAFSTVTARPIVAPVRRIVDPLVETRRQTIIFGSPHVMLQVLPRGRWIGQVHDVKAVTTKLKHLVNRYDIWTSFGRNRCIEMHVDWQKGLLDALPTLYLPTYQNTPVTVTVNPVALAGATTGVLRLEFCEKHSSGTLFVLPHHTRDKKITLVSTPQEVYFTGVKKSSVGDKTQSYVIRMSLIIDSQVIDMCYSGECLVTSSRRFYKAKNTELTTYSTLDSRAYSRPLWATTIDPIHLRRFNVAFHWPRDMINVLFVQDSIRLDVCLLTKDPALIINNLNVPGANTTRLIHLAQGIRGSKTRHNFLASEFRESDNGVWRATFDIRIHRMREIGGTCKLRLHWFDQNMCPVERFDYTVPLRIEHNSDSFRNKLANAQLTKESQKVVSPATIPTAISPRDSPIARPYCPRGPINTPSAPKCDLTDILNAIPGEDFSNSSPMPQR